MRWALLLLLTCALSASAARAETAVIPAAGSEPIAPAAVRPAGERRYEDLFLPERADRRFRLSWRPVRWGSPAVRLDGMPLQPDVQFTCDCELGIVELAVPAAPGSIVEASYEVVPYLSEPSAPAGGIRRPAGPFRVELPDFAAGPSPAPRDFREELRSGLRLTDVRERHSGPGARADVTYLRVDPVDPRAADAFREEFATSLSLQPGGSRLSVLSSFARESLFSEDAVELERRRVQLERSWGRSSASLAWEQRRSAAYGVANALDSLSLGITHPFTGGLTGDGYLAMENSLHRGRESESLFNLRQQLAPALHARAGLQYRESAFTGERLDGAFSLVGHPIAGSEVALSLRQSDSARYGRYQRAAADLTLPVSERLQLVGHLVDRGSERLPRARSFGLGMAAMPAARTRLEAAFSESVHGARGREQFQSIRLALDPSAALQVQLGYDALEGRDSGAENGAWTVSIGGRRYLRLEGHASRYDLGEEPGFRDAFYRVEVRPLESLAFSGQLRRVDEDADQRAVAGLGASLSLGRALELAAAYRRPAGTVAEEAALFGRDVRLSLAPVPGLRLFGQVSERPEDERGWLLDQVHRSLGLETRLGSFSLEGMLTHAGDGVTADPGRRVDLLASLSLGGRTRLYGGIRTEDAGVLDADRSRIYRLGISSGAGRTFFMLLEGQLGVALEPGGARAWDPDDTRAQARFGLRF